MVVMDNQGAKAFQSRTFGTAVNGCATQTFVCASNGAASIPEIEVPLLSHATSSIFQFNSGADGVQDGPAGGTTTAVLECNAAGTAWVFRGSNINTIECDAT